MFRAIRAQGWITNQGSVKEEEKHVVYFPNYGQENHKVQFLCNRLQMSRSWWLCQQYLRISNGSINKSNVAGDHLAGAIRCAVGVDVQTADEWEVFPLVAAIWGPSVSAFIDNFGLSRRYVFLVEWFDFFGVNILKLSNKVYVILGPDWTSLHVLSGFQL